MISDTFLEEYFELKSQESEIRERLQAMRKQIVEELECEERAVYLGKIYKAELKYYHEVTPEFVAFLKQTGNRHLVKESSNCKAFEEMNRKYRFTNEDKERFCILKKTPHLYVKKIEEEN